MISFRCIFRSALPLLFPLLACANLIPVANPSFEILPDGGLPYGACGTGCAYSLGIPIPSWTSSNDSASGQFQPGTQDGNTAIFSALDDGITSAWSRGATLSQTVGAVVQLGVTYTLFVDIGYRNDRSFDGSADLLINGTEYQAVGIQPELGLWSTYAVSYTGLAADVGAPITIELKASGAQGNFDNVRLGDSLPDPDPAPEPELYGMVGACLTGFGLFAHRKRAA